MSAPEAKNGGTLVHATALALGERGVLVRGPSGCGKSALALSLLQRHHSGQPSRLVADDQVLVIASGDALALHTPRAIAGLIEVRGVGLVRLPFRSGVPLHLVVDLTPAAQLDRMPAERDGWTELLGRRVRRIRLAQRDPVFAADVLRTLLGCDDWPVVSG